MFITTAYLYQSSSSPFGQNQSSAGRHEYQPSSHWHGQTLSGKSRAKPVQSSSLPSAYFARCLQCLHSTTSRTTFFPSIVPVV